MQLLYLTKGSLGSAAIEGNTLSEEEVLLHLEGKLDLPPSRDYLRHEVDNIIDACNQIKASIRRGELPALTPEKIKAMNLAVLKGLELNEGVVPGEIRTHSVGVEVFRYRGAPFQDCEYLLSALCDWLNGPTFSAQPGLEMVYAFIKAMVAHVYLAWIHPFGDGNGRTARLVEFLILISSGVPAPASHLLSNHYNQTRPEYYRQLDHSSKGGGDLLPFLLYAAEGFRDGLKSQLAHIFDQQINVIWNDYVFDQLQGSSAGVERRRHLAMDLALAAKPIPVSAITEISPRVARAYAGMTAKSLTRDINYLVEIGLVKKDKAGVSVCLENLRDLLPIRVDACRSKS